MKRTASEGARLLREYIDFAENGIKALNSQLNVKSDEHFDSTFEMEVYDFLKSKGFNVDKQVGCSGFKIDLALKSDNNSEYILAIECDGATYHSSKNARDRDRLRQEILENMGWKFYRIWSTDWFKNTSVEKERLLNVVRLALQNHDFQGKYSGTEEQKANSKWLQSYRDNPTFEFSKYKTADIDKIHIENPINFKQFVKLVLEVESPLSEEWFLRRISKFFGREKVTKAVINEYKKKMFKCSENGILRKKDFLYLEGKNVEFRIQGKDHRDFYFISPEELSVGMLKLIEKSISVGKEELYRYIMKLQDVYKLTTLVRKKLDEAFSLIEDKLNCDSNDKITLKNLDN